MDGELTQTDLPEKPTLPDRPLTAAAVFQVLLLTAGWGGNTPSLRFSLRYLPPNGSAALRFILGLAVVVGFAAWQRIPLGLKPAERKPLIWIALLFAAQIALLNYGTAYTAASRAGLLINAYPLFVPVIAHFSLRGDSVTWGKASGTMLAFLGILCVFGERFGKASGTALGDGLVLVSALFLAARVVYTSALVRGMHPVVLLFWQSVLSLPLFLLASAVTESHAYHWNPAVVFSIGYQGIVVAGVCFLGWTALLARFSPSRLSVGFFLTPVFATIISHFALGEPITPGLVLGGVIILGGLFLANHQAQRTAI